MLLLGTNLSVFALLFGGWEIAFMLAVVLILVGAKGLRGIARGLGGGFSQFRKAVGEVTKDLDNEAHDAGESLGGIYGKPAAQALTPDNQTAELYDPVAFHNPRNMKRIRFRVLVRLWRLLWIFVSKRVNPKI